MIFGANIHDPEGSQKFKNIVQKMCADFLTPMVVFGKGGVRCALVTGLLWRPCLRLQNHCFVKAA